MLGTNLPAYASGSRSAQIQSHGVVAYQSAEDPGTEVYMDSADFLFLADGMDDLERGYKDSLRDALEDNGISNPPDDWSGMLEQISLIKKHYALNLSNIICTDRPVNPRPGEYICYFAICYHHTGGGQGWVLGGDAGGSWHPGFRNLPYDASDAWLEANVMIEPDEYNFYLWCPK